ncbi:hypothetical protein OF83DRAFT_1067177, partial [Amylostereum chailletii]
QVELALAEAGVEVTKCEVDFKNKPEWFSRANPTTGQVPAIAYGGPPTAPEDPSPESKKLTDSLVLLEFIADRYPSSRLMPSDPFERAHIRFFLETFRRHVSPSITKVIEGLSELQDMLPPTGLVAGERYTIADAAISPFLLALCVRWGRVLENEDSKAAYETVFRSEKFARLQKYWVDVRSRESWLKVVDEVRVSIPRG